MVNNETRELLEQAAQAVLQQVVDLDISNKDGKDALEKSVKLVELLNTADKDDADFYDKQERRRIEEERNKAANDVEREKQALTPGRVALELGKVGLPILGSAFMFFTGIAFYYGIEKDGRVTSDGARMVLRQIPMIFKR